MTQEYQIKAVPEDFRVTELMQLDLKEEGAYLYFQLTKKNWTTYDAVAAVARVLHKPEKFFGYAGNKDKKAITTQYVSAAWTTPEQLAKLSLKDITLESVGFGEEPMYLGKNEGNAFAITVRKITELPGTPPQFINFFGEQRFSTDNIEIGKMLVQKKFKEAVDAIGKTRTIIPASDPLHTLTSVPTKILKLYVNAYQSDLWNRWIEEKKNASHELPDKLPLPGFSVKEDDILRVILEKEGITSRDFIIRQLPSISGEPLERDVLVHPQNLVIGSLEHDDLNPGFSKCLITFSLPKGCYATVIIEQLFATKAEPQENTGAWIPF